MLSSLSYSSHHYHYHHYFHYIINIIILIIIFTFIIFIIIIIIIIITIKIIIIVIISIIRMDDGSYWVLLSCEHLTTEVTTNCHNLFYYKVQWSISTLSVFSLQGTKGVITKCNNCYYNVQQLLLRTATDPNIETCRSTRKVEWAPDLR